MILQTERLVLRQAELTDAPFIFELVTDKSFIDNIADKGIKNLDDARDYIQKSLLDSYSKNGYGLYLTELKEDGTPVGLCGLVKRDVFEHPDVGYAFLPKYSGRGFATESAKAVIQYAKDVLDIEQVIGITGPDNTASIRVLEKIGLKKDKIIDYDAMETLLFI